VTNLWTRSYRDSLIERQQRENQTNLLAALRAIRPEDRQAAIQAALEELTRAETRAAKLDALSRLSDEDLENQGLISATQRNGPPFPHDGHLVLG
jgi:hypothetical protein